jgi:hypothetical protein
MRTVAPHSAKSDRTSASLPYVVPTVTPSSAATSAKRMSLNATNTTGADRPSSSRSLVRVDNACASRSRSDAQDAYAPRKRVSSARGGVCGSHFMLGGTARGQCVNMTCAQKRRTGIKVVGLRVWPRLGACERVSAVKKGRATRFHSASRSTYAAACVVLAVSQICTYPVETREACGAAKSWRHELSWARGTPRDELRCPG